VAATIQKQIFHHKLSCVFIDGRAVNIDAAEEKMSPSPTVIFALACGSISACPYEHMFEWLCADA
jgi:hypothetical protein